MEDIKRKCNSIVDLSKFTSNKKNIKWSCNISLQLSLLPKFIKSLIMLGLKKFRVVTNFFKNKKIIKFLKFVYNKFFFFQIRVSYDHPSLNVESRLQLFASQIFFFFSYYLYKKRKCAYEWCFCRAPCLVI